MLDQEVTKFIEDYMAFSCKYCYDIKNLTDCNHTYTKCLDKALFMAMKFCNKGWIREDSNGSDYKEHEDGEEKSY